MNGHKPFRGTFDNSTLGTGFMTIFNSVGGEYTDLVVAIYKQAIDDIIAPEPRNFEKKKQWIRDKNDAERFLKKNPYDLQVDFDGIIKKLKGENNNANRSI